MSDEKNLSPQQKEYVEKLKNAKMVLDAVNQQRKESIVTLKRKNADLQDSDKMTMEFLGTAAAVDTVRTMSNALNSTCQALDSHDKVIDMLINDLIGSMNTMRKMQEAMYELSASEETVLRALMAKGIVTEDELKVAYSALCKESAAQTACGSCPGSGCDSCPATPPDMS